MPSPVSGLHRGFTKMTPSELLIVLTIVAILLALFWRTVVLISLAILVSLVFVGAYTIWRDVQGDSGADSEAPLVEGSTQQRSSDPNSYKSITESCHP